jgi:hypothetical protein
MSLVLLAVIIYCILKILPALILMKSMHVKYIAHTICYPTRVPNSQKESNLQCTAIIWLRVFINLLQVRLQFDGGFKCNYRLLRYEKKTFVRMGKFLCSVWHVCAGGWVNPYGAVYTYSIITHFHKFSA